MRMRASEYYALLKQGFIKPSMVCVTNDGEFVEIQEMRCTMWVPKGKQ